MDKAVPKLEAAISELRDAGRHLFPGMKFLKYDLLSDESEKPGETNMHDRRIAKDQTCHEWSRHYDTIQWTVMALLLTAAGALLIYTTETHKFWPAAAASFLVLLSSFFNASFRRLRRKVHVEFSGEEKEWVHRIIKNDGILRQGRVSYLAQ